MLSRLFLALALLLGGTGLSRAVHVVMCGGPALRQWEGLRIQPDRHDNWWANFVRASTIRTMLDTGRDMQSKYKETAQGGLAVNVVNC